MWSCACCGGSSTFFGFFPSREVNAKNKSLKLEFLWEVYYVLDCEFPFEELEKMSIRRINDLITSKNNVDKQNSAAKQNREFKREMSKKPRFGAF